VLVSGAIALLATGALLDSPELAALGVTAVGLLSVLYLRFYPAAVLLWRRGLELVWTLERPAGDAAFYVGRGAQLRLSLRNLGARPLGVGSLRVFASSTLDIERPRTVALLSRSEVTSVVRLTPRQAGTWHVHGAALTLGDPLELFAVEAYFPTARAFQVLPPPIAAVGALPAADRPTTGAQLDRLGLHIARRRGLGGELRELREHVPGDPFKQIAWKATARTGRLMVRDVETTTLVTHQLLVDLGPTMRQGRPGNTKLDAAVDLCLAYAQAASAAGDRVGLITYDGRVLGEVRPGDGPAHRLRLLEPLLAATQPYDDDLTDVTDSELVVAVGRYLLHQDNVDTRVRQPPPAADSGWAHLVVSPGGDIYDLRVLFRAVSTALSGMKPAPLRAATTELAQLRQFCRMRGIELPARTGSEAGRRARGLAASLERVATGRGAQRIVVVSDLEGLDVGFPSVARAVRLVRRRGHPLLCAAPSARLFGGAAAIRDGVVAEIVFWDEQRREQSAWHRLASLGVRVLPVGPRDAARTLVSGRPNTTVRKSA
jgi:uncharacterized protein (DUF58 family)